MSNSDNPINGAIFQKQVLEWFRVHYKVSFSLEKKIPIGNPPKDHKFDIVADNDLIAIECKRYTWTETGNVPSAKMGFTNEAAFYLSFLPDAYKKIIVMLRCYHPKRKESLAEYYYRTYRHLLGNIIVAEFDPDRKSMRFIQEDTSNPLVTTLSGREGYIKIMKDYLTDRGVLYDSSLAEEIRNRSAGKKYTINDHVHAMIYALLSNQTKWVRIEPHLEEIRELFFDYDPEKILKTAPSKFSNGLFRLKCGNMSTEAQMLVLADNIRTLYRIEEEYGCVDAFITSEPADVIAVKLSKGSSPYKIKRFGEALAWEYLRTMGIDGVKPDTHLRRFLGSNRMGTGLNDPATVKDVREQVEALSQQTSLLKVEIDNIIWSFCADGYGEVCTATPHCDICPVKEFCNYKKGV
ncbi:MAG: hypothetical protein IJ198_13725 [Lachnospiraceae bacterium]|nr:hypothetical protein [Lachnospiraceae bacterium]